jgi:hypothetical protein
VEGQDQREEESLAGRLVTVPSFEKEAIGTQHLDLPHGARDQGLDGQEPPDHHRVGTGMPR